jgi:hypothetical protein
MPRVRLKVEKAAIGGHPISNVASVYSLTNTRYWLGSDRRVDKIDQLFTAIRAEPFERGRLDVDPISKLVHRLANNGDVVAFKMGRRQGGPSRTGAKGAYGIGK